MCLKWDLGSHLTVNVGILRLPWPCWGKGVQPLFPNLCTGVSRETTVRGFISWLSKKAIRNNSIFLKEIRPQELILVIIELFLVKSFKKSTQNGLKQKVDGSSASRGWSLENQKEYPHTFGQKLA